MVRPARLERATSWFVVAAEPNALAPTECYRLRFTPKTARFAPCASATISHGVVPRGGTNWGTANRTIDGIQDSDRAWTLHLEPHPQE